MTPESFQPASFPDDVGLEVEQGIIGSLLLNNEVLASVRPHMSAEDLGEPWHAKISTLLHV